MHIFWLNGSLVLEPENDFEGEALGLLVDNVKWGRPKPRDPAMIPRVPAELEGKAA